MALELKTEPRTVLGKKVKTLRRDGLIPAELYGHGKENKHLQIEVKEFGKIYDKAGEHTIIEAQVEGEKIPVIISGTQKNPITGDFFSIDLHQIRMDQKIKAHIPIEFKGEAPGEKEGLMLVQALDELEIETLPANLPSSIEVSLESLKKDGDTLHVSDITLPEGVEATVQPETVIVTISEPQEEEIEEEAPAKTEEGEEGEEGAEGEAPDSSNSAAAEEDKNQSVPSSPPPAGGAGEGTPKE